MTSIRKAKKAFKRNPFYKGRKVKTFVWYNVISDASCVIHTLTRRSFLYKKQSFKNFFLSCNIFHVEFVDSKRYKENLAL